MNIQYFDVIYSHQNSENAAMEVSDPIICPPYRSDDRCVSIVINDNLTQVYRFLSKTESVRFHIFNTITLRKVFSIFTQRGEDVVFLCALAKRLNPEGNKQSYDIQDHKFIWNYGSLSFVFPE